MRIGDQHHALGSNLGTNRRPRRYDAAAEFTWAAELAGRTGCGGTRRSRRSLTSGASSRGCAGRQNRPFRWRCPPTRRRRSRPAPAGEPPLPWPETVPVARRGRAPASPIASWSSRRSAGGGPPWPSGRTWSMTMASQRPMRACGLRRDLRAARRRGPGGHHHVKKVKPMTPTATPPPASTGSSAAPQKRGCTGVVVRAPLRPARAGMTPTPQQTPGLLGFGRSTCAECRNDPPGALSLAVRLSTAEGCGRESKLSML